MALVPCMSELKPPSQNNPGAPPARARNAILRAAPSLPTSMMAGCGPDAAELVMNRYPCSLLLGEQAQPVNGRPIPVLRGPSLRLRSEPSPFIWAGLNIQHRQALSA